MDRRDSRRAAPALAGIACIGLLAGCSSAAQGTAPTPTSRPSSQASASASASAVPADFSPLSVTFVSASAGFVLGSYGCGAAAPCVALLRTVDTGHTWTSVPPPPTHISLSEPGGVRKVRFADGMNGWAFDTELWATHDGGAHWTRPALPAGADGAVQSLEVGNGAVHALVTGNNDVQILDSPVGADAWTASSTTIPLGAGPVPQAQLTMQGDAGWAIEVDRTVIGGARLAGGRWTSWQPPCGSAGGPAWLAAATTTNLAAVCNEGGWTGPSVTVHVSFSTDGGSTFRRVAAPLPLSRGAGVALNTSGAVVVGGRTSAAGALLASFDGGATWSTVYSCSDAIAPGDLGFTTATQGVAMMGPHLLMTVDGGHSWSPVSFG